MLFLLLTHLAVKKWQTDKLEGAADDHRRLDSHVRLGDGGHCVFCREPLFFAAQRPVKTGGNVTCYFNALGVQSRLTNFEIFAARLKKQKVPLFVIEALFPGQKSSLAHFANVTTVECESVLWQKESLLNLLVRKLDSKIYGYSLVRCRRHF
jgi:hypothetical protein